jgi:hypothetical protein
MLESYFVEPQMNRIKRKSTVRTSSRTIVITDSGISHQPGAASEWSNRIRQLDNNRLPGQFSSTW